jgi:AGZA family xanthine/uracil permease-like MFS transporter
MGHVGQLISNYFKLKENDTSIKTEIIAGITTFLAMLYIVVVNSSILSKTGMPSSALVTTTVMIAAFSSIAMGIYSKNPFAVAPAMGMNVFFAYTVVGIWGIPWQTALGTVFWSGFIFFLLALFNIRLHILNGIPHAVKYAIAVGIGIFIALIGFYNGGLIVQSPSGLLEVAPISPESGIFLICLLLLIILFVLRIRIAILAMIVIGCVLAYFYSYIYGGNALLSVPEQFFSLPDFSLFFAIDWKASFSISLLPAMLTFLFINIFDSTGTIIGLSQSLIESDGGQSELKNVRQSLLMDALSAAASGLLGSSPSSVYVESGAGIAVGGRTGLTAVVTGLLFIPFLFLSPIVTMVPIFVVAPALVIVGTLMMSSAKKIDWADLDQSIPAFLTIILMPLTLSISEGIVWGMLAWFVIALLKYRGTINFMNSAITFCCFLMLLDSLKIL